MADTKISAFADGTTPAGTDNFVVERSGGNNKLSWTELLASMPGAEIGYDQITSGVISVSSSTEASGTTVISCAAHTFDGGPVIAEFFSVNLVPPNAAGFLIVSLFESSTQIARLAEIYSNSANTVATAVTAKYRFTPSVGPHTYTVTAYKTGSGSGQAISSGVAGTAADPPCYIRFTKV